MVVYFFSGVLSRTTKEAWVVAIAGRQLWFPDYRSGMLLAEMGVAAPVRKRSRVHTNK